MKRIAIPVCTRHISSLGGVGFFISSLVKLLKDEYIFDLILDRPVNDLNIPYDNLKHLSKIWPKESLSYSLSNKIDFFMGRKAPLEMTVNFYRAISESFSSRIYDFILINSVEAVPGILHSNIHTLVNTALFTHDPVFFDNIDHDAFYEFGEIHRCIKNITWLSQTSRFKNSIYLPMPNRETEFFLNVKKNTEKNTVYFCGTFRKSKRLDDFIDFCVKYKKKALVITNAKGEEYFKKHFYEKGVEFEIRHDIFGQEKVEFIARGEICFHPSEEEFYPYAVLEALWYMPVIVYKKEEWVNRFPLGVLNFYEDFNHTSLVLGVEYVKKYFDEETQKKLWITYINSFTKVLPQSRSKISEPLKQYIQKNQGISVADFWKKILPRDIVSFLDSVTLYKLAKEYPVMNTFSDSFLGNITKKIQDSNLNQFL